MGMNQKYFCSSGRRKFEGGLNEREASYLNMMVFLFKRAISTCINKKICALGNFEENLSPVIWYDYQVALNQFLKFYFTQECKTNRRIRIQIS